MKYIKYMKYIIRLAGRRLFWENRWITAVHRIAHTVCVHCIGQDTMTDCTVHAEYWTDCTKKCTQANSVDALVSLVSLVTAAAEQG